MSVLDRFRLNGKVALVTAGAGPLFGSSCTEALVQAGATIITASRSLERNQQYAEGLRRQGYDAHGMALDIGDPQSIERLADEIHKQFGRLDVLVNNALARPAGMGTLEELTLESLQVSAQADMIGVIWMCRAFMPQMARRGAGSVINIGSIYGVVGNDPSLYTGTPIKPAAAYSFIKGGLLNFTRSIAAYYGKSGVRANMLSPGGFSPDIAQTFRRKYEERCPLGRMMNHEDIQGAVVFLSSDASRYVTGANLMVDGGWTAI